MYFYDRAITISPLSYEPAIPETTLPVSSAFTGMLRAPYRASVITQKNSTWFSHIALSPSAKTSFSSTASPQLCFTHTVWHFSLLAKHRLRNGRNQHSYTLGQYSSQCCMKTHQII